MPNPWRMVGRAAELARLRALVAGTGRPHGTVVVGPAGVGKTRLMAEALSGDPGPTPTAPAASWVVGTHSARAIPFGAVADWVGTDANLGADPVAVLQATAARLLERADGPHAVVAVDDAHLLDPMSAMLIQRLVVSGLTRTILTARAGVSLPEPIAGLWKDAWLDRLELQPLSEPDVAALLGEVLGGPVETHSLRRLLSATAGSTLFLRELVQGELASGGLQLLAGKWYWRSTTTVPDSVVDLVRARLDTVPDGVRTVCELLAQSEPLPVAVLRTLADDRAVEESERLQLIAVATESRDGRLMARLRHPLYGDALRAAVPTVRARRLRTELVHTLETHADCDDEITTLQRAVLSIDSDAEADAPLLLHGALTAGSWYDFGLSERLSRAAMRAGAGFPAHLQLAGAVVRQGRVEEAVAEIRRLLSQCTSPVERAAAESLLACVEFWVHGAVEAATGRLERLRAQTTEPVAQMYLTALAACFAFFSGRPADARALAGAAMSSADSSPNTMAWAAAASTITDALAGRTTAALASAALGDAAVDVAGAERFIRLPVGNGEILALGLAGELHRAEERAREYERRTQAAAGREMSAAGSFFRGQAAWWRGELDSARHHLQDALTELEDFDSAGWSEQTMIVLVQTLAALGEPVAAQAILTRLESSARAVYPAFVPLLELARGWAAISKGAIRHAHDHVRRAVDEAEHLDQAAVAVLAWNCAARWGVPVELPRLRAVAGTAEGPRAKLTLRHAQALGRRRPAELDDVAVDWARLGALGAAADAAAQAAVLHRRQGAVAAAQASAHTATDLAARTRARTPALVTLSLPDTLTRREREIATLASTGMSNAEIAGTLVLSARTVEGHLNRAYAKLQIGGRTELHAALSLPIGVGNPDTGSAGPRRP